MEIFVLFEREHVAALGTFLDAHIATGDHRLQHDLEIVLPDTREPQQIAVRELPTSRGDVPNDPLHLPVRG